MTSLSEYCGPSYIPVLWKQWFLEPVVSQMYLRDQDTRKGSSYYCFDSSLFISSRIRINDPDPNLLFFLIDILRELWYREFWQIFSGCSLGRTRHPSYEFPLWIEIWPYIFFCGMTWTEVTHATCSQKFQNAVYKLQYSPYPLHLLLISEAVEIECK